jgi:hypothetical protein
MCIETGRWARQAVQELLIDYLSSGQGWCGGGLGMERPDLENIYGKDMAVSECFWGHFVS